MRLEHYGHGGDLATAEQAFGINRSRFIDFSSNMNPLGPPDCVKAVLADYLQQINCYPDPAVRALRARLADHHGVDEASVMIGNGAAELIDLAVRAGRPELVGLAEPCFTEYGDAARKAGARIATAKLRERNEFECTIEALSQIAERPDLWFLGSPNNPTGRPVKAEVIHALLQSGSQVVLDEAFMDFVAEAEGRSMIQEAAAHSRLLVIRSMTKFYAIPGIRLGYAIGHPDWIASLQQLQVPWSVNSLAQIIGLQVLKDKAFESNTWHWLREERPWLVQQLEFLGLRVIESSTNYLLIRLPADSSWSAPELQFTLGRRGILIRDASLFNGLDASWFRIAVRLRSDNSQLLTALAELLPKKPQEAGSSQ